MAALLHLPRISTASVVNSSVLYACTFSNCLAFLLFLALYTVVTPTDLQAHLAQVCFLSFTLCSVLTVKVGYNATRYPFALRRVGDGASSTGVVCSLTTVRLLPSATAHTEEAAKSGVPQSHFP